MDLTPAAPNPLLGKLKRVIPPETCRLPSRGILYKPEDQILHPEVKDGELLIFPMTTQDEILMRSVDMLYQGTALTTVFKRCIPQILKPEKLYLHDIEYLLGYLRKVSYGKFLQIRHTCKYCGTDEETGKKKYLNYDIPLDTLLLQVKNIDASFAKKSKCKINDFEFTIKPITHEEFIQYNQNTSVLREDASAEEISKLLVLTTLNAITKVDDVTDKN